MSINGREIFRAAAWFVLGALSMLLSFVLMATYYGR